MAKKNNFENPILIAVAAIAAIAPLYFVYKMFKKSIPLVKDPTFYDLSEDEKSELKGLYPEYLKLSREHEKNLSAGIRINASGDFDRRSKAGQQAQSVKSKLESLLPTVENLTHKPRLMFEQAVAGNSEKASAFIALIVFCITALIQLQTESGQVASENDSAIMAYLLGGLASIPVYFVGRMIVGRILSAKFQPFQPPIVSYESLRTHRHTTNEPEKPETEQPIRKERMTANTGIDISNPNAPENKNLINQKGLGAVYYCIPAIRIIRLEENEISDPSKQVIMSDLLSKGWNFKQASHILNEAIKMYEDEKISVEEVSSATSNSLKHEVLIHSLQLAHYAANQSNDLSMMQNRMLPYIADKWGINLPEDFLQATDIKRFQIKAINPEEARSVNSVFPININNPNAPENKDLREQKAKGAIYYAAPSIFVGMMDNNSMSKGATEILFTDLVSKGWQPDQVKTLLGQSMKLYQSDSTVETIAQRCKAYLKPDVMKDSMKTAFLIANDDGKFSPEEVGMLEQFLEVIGMTADQVLSE